MDQKTRKLMTIQKALCSGGDVDDVCQEKKEEEDSQSIKNSMDAPIQGPKTTLKKQRSNNYCSQWQHWQRKDTQNNNNSGRKTNI